MGWLFVRRRMAAELGAGWQEKFEEFSKKRLLRLPLDRSIAQSIQMVKILHVNYSIPI